MRIPAWLPVAVALGLGSPALAQAPDRPLVSTADLDRWMTEHSNWGRWGPDDQRGTLNLITPAKRREAAALVREGVVISLARDGATERAADTGNPYEQEMVRLTETASGDRIAIAFHGFGNTHLDALGHHFVKGEMYNGFERDRYASMEGGLERGSVLAMKEGIFTRGVLVDLPRMRGVPYLEPGTAIYVEDLEAWERFAGIRIGPGDALFIRTGRWLRRSEVGPWNPGQSAAGLDASVIPWLAERDIAVLGGEAAVDAVPRPPASDVTHPEYHLPVHNFVLVALGMPVLDALDLDALAEAAAARNRWEFLVTAAPLPIVNGTGSPINPTAVF